MARRSLPISAIGRVLQLPPSPELPIGFTIDLPGRGTTFAAEVPGPTPDAPTLFLLHGLACTGYLNWFPSLAELSKRYRLVLMDQRGHGRGIPSGRFLRLSDCADDAIALADALGIERFIAVGYSMGGPVAQLMWKHRPDRVEGLVLCATARNFRGTPYERLFFLLLPSIALAGGLRRPNNDARVALARTLMELPDHQRLAETGLPQWAWSEFRRTSLWTVVQGVNAIGQFSSRGWIDRVDVPTAVVITGNDSFIPPRRQLKLAQAIPGATVHAFPGNHAACVLEADRFVPVLSEAVASVVDRL